MNAKPLDFKPTRTGLSAATLQRAILDNLACVQGRYPDIATPHDWCLSLYFRRFPGGV